MNESENIYLHLNKNYISWQQKFEILILNKIIKYCRGKKFQTILLLFYIIFWQTGIYQILTRDNVPESNHQIQTNETVLTESENLLEEYSLNNSVSISNQINDILQLKYEQKIFQEIVKITENFIVVSIQIRKNESNLKVEKGSYQTSIPRSPPFLT